MVLKKIKSDKRQKLSKAIAEKFQLAYNKVQSLIREKNVKVAGKRVKEDCTVEPGDEIDVYVREETIKCIFENDDIVVVCKPRGIEVETLDDECLKSKLEKQIKTEIFAVHRLDRNTVGLVVFAKNANAKNSLDVALKNRTIDKYYLALVFGKPKCKNAKLSAYLKKDEIKKIVKIVDEKTERFEEIKTNYKLLWSNDEISLLEVELVTGKTHQIRAHLAHVGLPIVGDEKYGDHEKNVQCKKRYQCLFAYKMIFHFESKDYLNYLNGLKIEINRNEIDFCKNL